MVKLHVAIKTIQNEVFVFFLIRKICFFKKKQKHWVKKSWVVFLKKRIFLNPDYLSILFCDFLFVARSGTSNVTISLIGCAPHT